MDDQSIQHTKWNCTYHIVFIPKYRRKVLYGTNKKDIAEIIKKLCDMKGVNLIEGHVCVDHIHIYVAIPPKLAVSEFMSNAIKLKQTSAYPTGGGRLDSLS